MTHIARHNRIGCGNRCVEVALSQRDSIERVIKVRARFEETAVGGAPSWWCMGEADVFWRPLITRECLQSAKDNSYDEFYRLSRAAPHGKRQLNPDTSNISLLVDIEHQSLRV